MKPIPPTLKPKKRYIAFKVYTKDKVLKKDLIKAINNKARIFFGELRAGDFGLWVLDYDEERKTGFVVCNHKWRSEIITCLTLIGALGKDEASIQVLGVSGTIKALKRKF